MPEIEIIPAPTSTSPEPFWMCYIPSGGAPIVRHPSEEEAIAEGRRLTISTKKDVFILHCVGVVALERVEPPVTFTRM